MQRTQKNWKDIHSEMQLFLHFPIKFSKEISKFYIIIDFPVSSGHLTKDDFLYHSETRVKR